LLVFIAAILVSIHRLALSTRLRDLAGRQRDRERFLLGTFRGLEWSRMRAYFKGFGGSGTNGKL